MKNLDCTFNVHGAVRDTSFVLRVKAPPSPSRSRGYQFIDVFVDTCNITCCRDITHFFLHCTAPPEPNITKLTKDDIEHIIKILSPLAGYWKKIGAHIGFKIHELAAIESDLDLLTQNGCIGFLSKLLNKWQASSPEGAATLEALESALRSPQVNLQEAAKELRQDIQKSKQGNYKKFNNKVNNNGVETVLYN